MTRKSLRLFEAYGIELEYMIVDRDTLDVKPVADRLLAAAAEMAEGNSGEGVLNAAGERHGKGTDEYSGERSPEVSGEVASEVERGAITWSNELALHVVEFKTSGPAPSLDGLAALFQREVEEANRLLEPMNARLMPGAMHPWMDPEREMKLWPHEYNPIYEAYNRIFDCRGHGWGNLQSTHINLPFTGDREFGILHAAIRMVLPLLPALAASSPVADCRLTGFRDYRLEVYRTNSVAIPSVTGRIVPEPVFTRDGYKRRILQQMYRDIAPHDPDGILQEEWLNSRGAIARFDRGSIEIRLLDIQECPLADLAIVRLVTDVLQALATERWGPLEELHGWSEISLQQILLRVMREGEEALISDPAYLSVFGLGPSAVSAGEIWRHLYDFLYDKRVVKDDDVLKAMDTMLIQGTLSTRIIKSVSEPLGSDNLLHVYKKLCNCLSNGNLF